MPHWKLITALQLMFTPQENYRQGAGMMTAFTLADIAALSKTTAHIIGNSPITQNPRTERHNSICETISNEAKRQDWTVFQDPHIRMRQMN